MSKKYAAIYADPPWTFKTYSEKGEGRSASAHYDCMSMAEIQALPIREFAADDCVLFLWVPNAHLAAAMDLIKAWDFKFKTIGFVWAKIGRHANVDQLSVRSFPFSTGYWTRSNCEICLLATRGRPQRLAMNVSQLVLAPRREHSRKPDEMYDRIERLVPGPYLELFARQTWPGWDALGDQVGLFDNGPVETRRRPSTSRRRPGADAVSDL